MGVIGLVWVYRGVGWWDGLRFADRGLGFCMFRLSRECGFASRDACCTFLVSMSTKLC